MRVLAPLKEGHKVLPTIHTVYVSFFWNKKHVTGVTIMPRKFSWGLTKKELHILFCSTQEIQKRLNSSQEDITAKGIFVLFWKTYVTELFIPRERIQNEHNVIW